MTNHRYYRRSAERHSIAKDREDARFASKLMEQLSIAAFVLDGSGRVLIWNRACERLTGVLAAEVIGTMDHWKALYEEERPCLADLVVRGRLDETKSLYEAWSNTEVNPHGISAERWCAMPRIGKQCFLAFDVGAIYDDMGRLVAVVETLRDLTSHKQTETELEHLAGSDALTSISNRRTFDAKLAEEWRRAKRNASQLSLMIIDVDFFKQYNDAYGHQAGDECLRMVAKTVDSQALRAGDLAARIGGEEFAVLLPQTSSQGALAVAERIRKAIEGAEAPHCGSSVSPNVTVSIGVMTATTDLGLEYFVKHADAALYEAKNGGRNRTVSYVLDNDRIEDRKSA